MTTLELKTQIQKELDKVPESILQNVLDYLKQVQQQSPEQIRRDINFRRILSEDKELLNRLAK
jgi:mRNA-degrading endonuclease RelE of RelBE toxin-antitoxin system